MSAAFDFDNGVTVLTPLSSVQTDDPFARLFFDRTTTLGTRLLAVAEPVDRKPEGYLAAASAIAAFEEALSVAVAQGAEAGLTRAFFAANDALRSANRRVMASKRSYVGITAFVIEGQSATIGFVPPGQALLIQDGRLYGVPHLESWKAGFMPTSDQAMPDPLGFSVSVRPQIRTTQIGIDDQFVLGASAVGRVLANQGQTPFEDGVPGGLIGRLEDALADSGVDDAYAAWIRCDPTPVSTISSERLAEFERIWRGQQSEGLSHPATQARQADPKLRRAATLDSLHSRLIDTSERLLARKEPECLPLESRRRLATPPGAFSLERYVAPRAIHLGPGLRSIMPRGLGISGRSLLGLFLILSLVAGAALTRDVELGRGASQDELLSTASIELQLARTAGSDEEANQHLELAQRSIDRAFGKGSNSEVAVGWRNEIAIESDKTNGIIRLGEIDRIGSIPDSLQVDSPQLLMAFDRLFLISDGVFEVGDTDHHLMPLLAPGDVVDSTNVGTVRTAAADANGLLVSDGDSLFFMDRAGNWSASPLGVTSSTDSAVSGLYKGNYYLLDSPTSQVLKFPDGGYSTNTIKVLSDEALTRVTNPVDLAVDGYVYILQDNGTVKVFFKGEYKGSIEVVTPGVDTSIVGLYRGDLNSDLYVVAIDNGSGTLTLYDRTARENSLYALPTKSHQEFNAGASAAFAETTDFVIDESAGIIYFLTVDSVWQASLN